MSINLSVPLESLQNPDVARALSQLMLSLGGLEVAPPKVVAAPKAVATPRRRAATKVVKAAPTVATAAPARRRRAPAKAKAKARAKAPAREQSYADFVANLPDPSRRFLDLIQKHGTLRLSQAVRELGITRPKTLGGITGSLTRWANQRGVELPYKTGKSADGERIWTWTRGGESGATAKRSRARRRTGGRSSASSRSKKKESEAPAVTEEQRPDVTGRELLRDDRYLPLVEGMTDTAKRFLVALSEARELTMTQALEAIERKRAKSVGDAVRAYVFRARERGIKLPFEERAAPHGGRMWVWKGLVAPEPEEAKPPSERPGVRVIRGGRGRARNSA